LNKYVQLLFSDDIHLNQYLNIKYSEYNFLSRHHQSNGKNDL
jgi:hypothetical protein